MFGKLENTTVNVKVAVDAKVTEKMQPRSVNNDVIIQAVLAARDSNQFFKALGLLFGGFPLQEKEIEKLMIEQLADILGKMTSEQVLEMKNSLSSFSGEINAANVDFLNLSGFCNLLEKAKKQKIAIMREVPEQDSKAIDAFNTLLEVSRKLRGCILFKLKLQNMSTMVTGLPIVEREMETAVSQIGAEAEAQARRETEAAARAESQAQYQRDDSEANLAQFQLKQKAGKVNGYCERDKIEETPIFKAIDKLMADIGVNYLFWQKDGPDERRRDPERWAKIEATILIFNTLTSCKEAMLKTRVIDFNDPIYQNLIKTFNAHSSALLAPHRKLLGKIVSFLVRLVTFGQVDFETGGKKHVAKPTQDFINKIIAAKQASQSFADSEKKNDEPQDAGRRSPRM